MKFKCITILIALSIFACMMSACVFENKTNPDSETTLPISDKKSDTINSWEFDTPENHGVNGAMLDDFYDMIKEHDVSSVVIVKDGKIISEYYKSEIINNAYGFIDTIGNDSFYNEKSLFELFSCSKSIMSTLIGIAIDKEYINDVDTKISDYFPQLAGDEHKKNITIEDLLTHTSGIEWDEGSTFNEWLRSYNFVDFIINLPMSDEPGSKFNYNTGGTHLLSAMIQNATGKDAYNFARENLFQPIGMNSVKWVYDDQGIALGGLGVAMTSRDAAKFGQLFLNNGKWQDKQIVSEEWVQESTKPQLSGISDAPQYGYLWWISTDSDVLYYTANGYGGQFIFVVPEMNLVTVITSWFSDINIEDCFNDYILKACEK